MESRDICGYYRGEVTIDRSGTVAMMAMGSIILDDSTTRRYEAQPEELRLHTAALPPHQPK